MVIVNFSGLDIFLVGELNKAVHEKVAAAYGLDDEDVIFQASDSFIFYKGTEQTSFNLLIKISAIFFSFILCSNFFLYFCKF